MTSLSTVATVAVVLQASPAPPRLSPAWRAASAVASGGGRGRPAIHLILAGRAAHTRRSGPVGGNLLPQGVKKKVDPLAAGNRSQVPFRRGQSEARLFPHSGAVVLAAHTSHRGSRGA